MVVIGGVRPVLDTNVSNYIFVFSIQMFAYIFCLHFFVYNFTGKRSPQNAHFVESDYGPPFKYAEPPEIGER